MAQHVEVKREGQAAFQAFGHLQGCLMEAPLDVCSIGAIVLEVI